MNWRNLIKLNFFNWRNKKYYNSISRQSGIVHKDKAMRQLDLDLWEMNWLVAAAQQRKAKAIPFFSLRMGRMDCFAFSLRACRPREWMNSMELCCLFFWWVMAAASGRGSAKRKQTTTTTPIEWFHSCGACGDWLISFFFFSLFWWVMAAASGRGSAKRERTKEKERNESTKQERKKVSEVNSWNERELWNENKFIYLSGASPPMEWMNATPHQAVPLRGKLIHSFFGWPALPRKATKGRGDWLVLLLLFFSL